MRRSICKKLTAAAVLVLVLALGAHGTAEAGPTKDQLQQAVVSHSDLGPGFTRSTQATVVEFDPPPFAHAFGAYIRVVPSSSKLESVLVVLADGSVGPAADQYVQSIADSFWRALGGTGEKRPQAAPAIGTGASRSTRFAATRFGPLAGDQVSWHHRDVVALVITTADGVEQTSVLDYAQTQQARLESVFGPAVTPAASAAPSPTPSPTPVPATVPQTPAPPSAPLQRTPSATVQVHDAGALGPIVTDSQGFTLYTFDGDAPGASACLDDCAVTWPPLILDTGDPLAPEALTGTLGTITRADGRRQVTYNDRPLYRYAGDLQPGDTSGDGIDGAWHVAVLAPPTAQ